MERVGILLLEYLPNLLQAIAWVMVGWVWWSLKRVFVRHEDLQEFKMGIDSRLSELEAAQQARLSTQEQFGHKLDLLPTAKDMQRLMLSLKDLEGDTKSMNQKFDGLQHSISRLERAVDLFTEAHMGTNK